MGGQLSYLRTELKEGARLPRGWVEVPMNFGFWLEVGGNRREPASLGADSPTTGALIEHELEQTSRNVYMACVPERVGCSEPQQHQRRLS